MAFEDALIDEIFKESKSNAYQKKARASFEKLILERFKGGLRKMTAAVAAGEEYKPSVLIRKTFEDIGNVSNVIMTKIIPKAAHRAILVIKLRAQSNERRE